MDEERYIKQFLSLKSLIIVFFIFIFFWLVRFLYHFNISFPQGYILGDWLVNYQDGGFKRRGLTGSLLFLIQNFSGISLQALAYCSQLLLYFIFFLYLSKILLRKKISIYFLTLVISPLTLMFYFNDVESIGKKEQLIFALFAFFIFLLAENKLSKTKEALICILIFIATLCHEVMFFYTPYFIVALYFFTKKIEIRRYIPYFLASFIPVVLIYVFGNSINEGNSIGILLSRGVTFSHYSQGIFIWPEGSEAVSHAFAYYKERAIPYIMYSISLIAGLLHFFYFIYLNNKKNLKKLLILSLALIIYTIPLFVLAIDWGRWIHSHFMLLLILFAAFLENKDSVDEIQVIDRNSKGFSWHWMMIPIMLLWGMPGYGSGFVIKKIDFHFYPVLIHVAEHQVRNSPTPDVLLNLSLAYYNEKQYEKCIEVCEHATKINPDFFQAYNNICSAYNALGQWDKAIEACDNALRIYPDYTLAKANKAWAFQNTQTLPENPTAEYYLNLSLEYYNMQMFEKSIEACNNAINLKPDYAQAYYNKCCAYIGLSQWDNAVSDCQKALDIMPDFEAAKINLEWSLKQKNASY
ncbi:MAG: tetratricopeptide repeat protein [Bacteroidales bacterium]|nr:tetratricopeptide repeat protein [Bacteroidales bacterium]